MATNINNKLVCNEPHANLDSYYGPYNSVDEAYSALSDTTVNGVTYTKKFIGLTVGVWKDSNKNEIIEYWFKGGLNKSNLVEKTSGGGGLPGNIKIVTFDKNGGSGVQNSILTDTNSQVKLPECTFTKSGETFTKWSYNGSQYNPGDIITIGSATVVQAVWSSTKPSHKITWSAGTGVSGITGTVNGVAISSGDSVKEGSSIKLTAAMNSGYNFSQWSGLPSGTSTNNPVSFAMGTSNISVTATGRTVTTYSVNWAVGSHVTITGEANGRSINNGATLNAGTVVILTATPDSDYTFKSWLNKPTGATETGNKLTFTLNSNVSNVTATAEPTVVTHQIRISDDGGVQSYEVTIAGTTQVYEQAPTIKGISSGAEVQIKVNPKDGYAFDSCVVTGASPSTTENPIKFTMRDANVSVSVTTKQDATNEFNYFACGAPTSKGEIEGDQPDNSVMWFDKVGDLINCKSGSVKFDKTNKYTIFYVVSDRTDTPILTVDSNAKNFYKLHECQNETIIAHFEEARLVEAGTNQTMGDLKAKGDYIYIFIGKEAELGGKLLTISFNK